MEMLDTVVETRFTEDGKAQVRTLYDESDAAALNFALACEEFIRAEKAFCKLNAVVRTDSAADVCEWFDLLEARYETEKRVWTLFVGGDRSRRTGRLYLQFREALLAGRSLRADA
jgi:hypothetical protein